MVRKIVITGIVILLAVFVIVVFLFLRKKTDSGSDPLRAVPVDATLILKISDFRKFEDNLIVNNKIWKDLGFISSVHKIDNDIHFLDSISRNDDRIARALFESEIYISTHFIGGRKTEFLFLLAGYDGQNIKNIISILSDVVGKDILKSARKYEGQDVYSVKVPREEDQQVNYYIASVDGNLLISKSVILIENAIRQYSLPGSLNDEQGFELVANTAGKNKDANLIIDFRKFPGLLSTLVSPRYSQRFREYKDFSGWAEFDLHVSEKLIMLNGFLGEEADGLLPVFKESDPIKISVDKVLPASVSAFLTVGSNNIPLLNKNFESYLTAINKYAKRDNRLSDIERKYSVRLNDAFISMLDNEITLALGGYNEQGRDMPARYVLVKCKSGSQAKKSLEGIVSTICNKKGIDVQGTMDTYTVDSDTKFVLTKFPIENVTGLLFGELFGMKGDCYFTFLGNYLVFSDSENALGHFLYSNVLSKTLTTNEGFKKFYSNIDQESNLLFYTNLGRSSSVFREYMHPDIMNSWEDNFDKFQKIQSFGFQITKVSNMSYGNILIQYLDEYKGKPQTVWESLLDTAFTFKPQLVENHYTRQKEIFLQDSDNTIYLINKAGRILWKQKLSESINSEVMQLDYYKNGKLQLVFSTDNYLHIIDRNGNYVERYPVRLREKASAGMALFDYEGNKDYRMFIPCIDHAIYAYSTDGNIISGWKFSGSDNEVCSPLKHFRVEGMDFIVFGDKYRTYILDRRGSVRVNVNEQTAKSRRNTYFLENRGTLEKSRIVTTDTAGHVISISFDGSVSITEIGDFSSDHFFDFKDINADGRKDYILMDRDNLSVIDQDRSRIFSFGFPNELNHRPIYFRFSYNDRKLGCFDMRDGKIYLINNDGSLYKGFPLEGKSLFTIGYLEKQEGEFNLIVGGSNNFLYNYSVQ